MASDYPQLNDPEYLRKRLLVDKVQPQELTKEIGCKRWSLTQVLRKILTPAEMRSLPKKRRKFSPNQKRAILEQVMAVGNLRKVALERGISPNLIWRWKKQAQILKSTAG